MDYEVLHKPSYALARIRLDPREQLQAETGAMVSMSDSIKMETGTRGGIARTAPARSRFYSLLALTALLVALLVLAACGAARKSPRIPQRHPPLPMRPLRPRLSQLPSPIRRTPPLCPLTSTS